MSNISSSTHDPALNVPRIFIPPGAENDWRLLTPLNIQVRRLWPWAFSIQKIISASEPHPRKTGRLFIASDYGGEHPRATHHIYCYLVVRGGGRQCITALQRARERLLPDRRRMSYKRLDDGHRRHALIPYLQAAADLDGHLVAIAVDKRKKWLSTTEGTAADLCQAFGLRAKWSARGLELLMRKVHFNAIMLSIWSQPYCDLTWITDQDEFVANDRRHDDALLAGARMSSFYVPHPMGVFRLNTTGQDSEATDYEDVCAIPDLAAGMLSEIATRVAADMPLEDGVLFAMESGMPTKAEIIADWFWDDRMSLRKTLISIDVRGSQYAVRKVHMANQYGGSPAQE